MRLLVKAAIRWAIRRCLRDETCDDIVDVRLNIRSVLKEE